MTSSSCFCEPRFVTTGSACGEELFLFRMAAVLFGCGIIHSHTTELKIITIVVE